MGRHLGKLCFLLFLVGCPGGSQPPSGGVEKKRQLTVVASFGSRIEGARVQVWGNREHTALLGEGVTDGEGRVEFGFFRQTAPVWVCTAPGSGGRFVDLDTGTTTTLKVELHRLVELHELAEEVSLSPRTTEAFAIAEAESEAQGVPFVDAWHEAINNLNALYDCLGSGLDVVRAVPAAADGSADDRTEASQARFEFGGESAQASRISHAYGSAVDTQTFWRGKLEDIRFDRLWDGQGQDGQIYVGGYALSPATLRWGDLGYAHGIRAWARSEHYQGGLSEEDVTPLAFCFAEVSGPYFPSGSIGTVDFDGPLIRFESPPENSLIQGNSVPVIVTAQDPAGVHNLSLGALDGLVINSVDLESVPARVDARFDATGYTDGSKVVFVVKTKDDLDNPGQAERVVRVLHDVPEPRPVLVPDSDTVQGRMSIGCDCSADIPAPIHCSLVNPSPEANNVDEISAESDRVMYIWETAQELDGPYVLICKATVDGLDAAATATRALTIDNVPASQYCGTAPANAEIRARLLTAPDVIGTTTASESGDFCVEVDYEAAPIVLEVVGRSAQLKRFAEQQSIAMGNNKLALYLQHEPGVTINGLTPDGVTSLAAALCLGIHQDKESGDTAAQCSDVHHVLGSYALADQALGSDIRMVPMAPWGADFSSSPRDAQYKLLWHAAADCYAEQLGVHWLDLVTKGVADGSADAVLDGVADSQLIIRGNALDGLTFRSALGRAGLLLSRGVPIGDSSIDVPAGITEEVDYWVHLAQFDGVYFYPQYGGVLDVEPPQLSPSELSQRLADDVTICIGIEDDSDIVDGGFAVDRDGGQLEQVTIADGKLCGVLKTQSYDDGTIAVSYWVEDANGGRAQGSYDGLHITNHPPELLDLSSECTLSDESIAIEVCAQHEHLDSMRVLEPTVVSQSFDKTEGQTGCLHITMAPEDYDEGTFELKVEATGGDLPESRSYDCTVDKYDPGQLHLCAFADTALQEATVHACWLAADGSCEPLDRDEPPVTDSAGCADLPLPDDRSGLLHVRTSGGWYWSAEHRDGTDEPVRTYASDDQGVTATYPYEPSRPGTVLAGRAASYGSTWADAWAMARLGPASTTEQMDAVVQEGYQRLGAHFGRDMPDEGIDIRRTIPRDFLNKTPHTSATSEASNRLGLVQVAIAHCAARWAIDNGSAADALPSLSLAGVIAQDHLYYDGLDSHNNTLTVMGHDLSHNTLRHEAMTCAAVWLDSDRNPTALQAQNFSQPGGFFMTTSANQDAQLFGSLASDFVVFDRTPPIVLATLVDQDLALLPLSPLPVDRVILLRVVSSDDGGFSGADGSTIMPAVTITPGSAAALGRPQVYESTNTTIGITYPVDLAQLQQGAQTLSVTQHDAVSNVGDGSPITFVVDKEPATLTPTIPEFTRSPEIDVSWRSNEELSEVSIYDAWTLLAKVTGGAEAASVDLGECNKEHHIALEAKDLANNITRMPEPVAVLCDALPPEFLSVKVSTHANSTELPVSWTTNEPMESVSILLGGSVVKTVTDGSNDTSITLPACDGSTYVVSFAGEDRAGNPGDGPAELVTCETVKPEFLEFILPRRTKLAAVVTHWQVNESLKRLDVLMDDTVVASYTDGTTSHLLQLPACDEEDHRVRLVAVDLAGNEGQSEEKLAKCDDSPPLILSRSMPRSVSGTHELAEVEVSWTVNEALSMVAFTAGGFEHQFTLNQSIDSIAVPLPWCDAEHLVVMRAFDLTGNGSDPAGPDVVECDMYDPELNLVESIRVQEDAAPIVCDVNSCSVTLPRENPEKVIDLSLPGQHHIVHYKNRYYHGQANMPFVRFLASDLGEIRTTDDALVVEYFYHGGDGDGFTEWRPLLPLAGGAGAYELELSPETLLPSVYDTDAEQLHTVTFRARDEAGRYSEEISVDFYLELLLPPLVLSEAQLSQGLMNYSFAEGNVHEFFSHDGRAEVLTMEFCWPWGSNNEPSANATIDLSGAQMRTAIFAMRQQKYTGEYEEEIDFGNWSCGNTGHTADDRATCTRRLAAAIEGVLPVPSYGDGTHHDMTYQIVGATHLGGGTYEIEPNRLYELRVSAVAPHVDIDGQSFDWNQRHGHYEYATERGMEYDSRRSVYHSDLQREVWHLNSRSYEIQTYVAGVAVVMDPLAVTFSADGQLVPPVAARDNEACLGSWDFAFTDDE